MRSSTWIAIGITAAVAAWLASGLLIGGEEEQAETESTAPQPTLVEARRSTAESVPQYIYAQGVAQPFRSTDVISSTAGTLSDVEVGEGDEVESGAVLAQVRLEARSSELASAEAQVESLEADLAAVRELESQGFATQARVRELRSQLENARAALESIRAEIRDTTIEAPISGIVSEVYVNSGQTAPVGTRIARIVDNAPLRVVVQISQRDIGSVETGREAVVSFATGALAKGRVCFVAPAADPETRTFRVEIRVPNEDRKIPSVVSTEVRFQTGEADAHFVSPAILSLSEAGELGLKSVDDDNVVHFHPVEMVRAGTDGMWVAGPPDELLIITTGQGFVREGERIRAREEEGEEAASGESGRAPLPTSTVEDEEFDGAEDLAKPPPAEELCRGAAASSLLTGSVPGAAGSSAASSPQTQPEGRAGGTQVSPDAGRGVATDAGSVSTGVAPETEPISPSVPAPSAVQPSPQTPSGVGQQQGQSGMAPGSTSPGAGAGAAQTPPGGGGAEGGGP